MTRMSRESCSQQWQKSIGQASLLCHCNRPPARRARWSALMWKSNPIPTKNLCLARVIRDLPPLSRRCSICRYHSIIGKALEQMQMTLLYARVCCASTGYHNHRLAESTCLKQYIISIFSSLRLESRNWARILPTKFARLGVYSRGVQEKHCNIFFECIVLSPKLRRRH